jgi:hypothetical protein
LDRDLEEAVDVFRGLQKKVVHNSNPDGDDVLAVLDYCGGFYLSRSGGFSRTTWVVSAWAMPTQAVSDHVHFISESSRPPEKWIALLPKSGEDLMGERIMIPVRAKVIKVPG